MTNQEYLIGVMNDVETIKNTLQRIVKDVVGDYSNIDVESGIFGNQLYADIVSTSYDGNDGIIAWEFNVNRNGTTSNVMWHDNVMFGLGCYCEIGDDLDDTDLPYRTDIMTMLDAELRSFDWASRLKVLSIEFHTQVVSPLGRVPSEGGL